MLLHFFSKVLILLDLLLEVTFKDFKAIRNFCKSVVKEWLLLKNGAVVQFNLKIYLEIIP